MGGGIGGNVGALAAGRQRWGFVGASVAARQGGFCRLALGWARWHGGVVGVVVLSRRWHQRTGVGGGGTQQLT